MKRWKSFLLQESIGDYSINGMVRLYHYSRAAADSVELDPKRFLTHRGHYSRNDYNASDVPRVFFYVDLDHAERFIKQGAELFSAKVPAADIYDLTVDPLGLIEKSKPAPYVAPDMDYVLRALAQSSENILPAEASAYRGAYYKTGGMGVVVWFEPIQVKKFLMG